MACAAERQDHRPPPLYSRRKRQERRGRLWRDRAKMSIFKTELSKVQTKAFQAAATARRA